MHAFAVRTQRLAVIRHHGNQGAVVQTALPQIIEEYAES